MQFKSEKYDFWKIYDCIKHYYPIGTPAIEGSVYFSYPGLKELGNLIVENFHTPEIYEQRWESFALHVQSQTDKTFVGTTYGQVPCFSFIIEIENTVYGDLTRVKDLHCFISLLGPFYTIIGQDGTTVIRETKSRFPTRYQGCNYLVASPVEEYSETFNLLCKLIEERFTGYRFVPFSFCRWRITGLQTKYTSDTHASVLTALTGNNLNLNTRTIGDESFKADDWIMEGYVDDGGGWSAFPPDWTEEQRKAAIENAEK